MKKNVINLKDYHITKSFKIDLGKKQKGVTVGPGEESSIFEILKKRPDELEQLIISGAIKKKNLSITPASFGGIEWNDADFQIEFYAARPQAEMFSLIGPEGKCGRMLSVETLRRLKFWIAMLPSSGGIWGNNLNFAIERRLKALGQPLDIIEDDPEFFEKELAWLEKEKKEEELEKERIKND